MLWLKQSGDDQAGSALPRLPLSDQAAAALERALLASDPALRRCELERALAADSVFAGWVLRRAEIRTNRTINRVDEAADWLIRRLEIELATALGGDNSAEPSSDLDGRLFALVTKLADYERKLLDFDRRLEHAKLESLKELAYGASHEINNPLANIAARAQTLLTDESDPERARKLTAIHRQALRAHEMISDLMLFARPPKITPQPIDLQKLVNRIVEEQREFANEHDVALVSELTDQTLEVLADETQLGVAVHAVVKNALEAVFPGGHVRVGARAQEMGARRFAEICVRDDGPGIPDTVRPHVFDPFFSGREAGRGLGFGLSKCWRIVTDHGGQVIVAEPASGGAEFRIQLPLPYRL
jgi:signal transduction histidine kinase